MLLQEAVEVAHESVDRVTHVQVPNVGPDTVAFRQDCVLLFDLAMRGLEVISTGQTAGCQSERDRKTSALRTGT